MGIRFERDNDGNLVAVDTETGKAVDKVETFGDMVGKEEEKNDRNNDQR